MLESIDKLRKWTVLNHTVHHGIEVETFKGKLVPYEKAELDDIADEIEREIAECYMLLPVDADGVPIRMGDKLEHTSGSWTFTADSLEIDQWGTYVRPNGQARVQCSNCRHVKPRTVEDVLRDFVNEAEWDQSPDSYEEIERRLITLYAAELRDLLGGDADD